MSRREQLLNIGKCFDDTKELTRLAGNDVITDMALFCYAMVNNKLEVLREFINVDELTYDIQHTAKHYELLQKRKEFKEEE